MMALLLMMLSLLLMIMMLMLLLVLMLMHFSLLQAISQFCETRHNKTEKIGTSIKSLNTLDIQSASWCYVYISKF